MIFDTAALIAAERGTFDMGGFLAHLADEPVALAAISASELLHGVERARAAAPRAARGRFVEAVLANLPIIPFGLTEARIHAHMGATLAARGRMIGVHDLQIAATALAAGNAVATLHRDDFRRVAGLTLGPLARFVSG